MQEMFAQFKKDIEYVIYQYEQLFEIKNKSMSEERSDDIVNIKGILREVDLDFDRCREILSERLKKFKTGWWIFNTGNSRLRTEIMKVMDNYNHPFLHLFLSNNENKGQRFNSSKPRESKSVQELEMSLIAKDRTIKILQEEVQRKQKTLTELLQKQILLEKENQRLKQVIELEQGEKNIAMGSMKFK